MSLKDKISSPLEAGISILDGHNLPSHLTPALEYISDKLARKSLYLTLVVVRRDYQLPAIIPPPGSPGMQHPPPSALPFSPSTAAAAPSLLHHLPHTPASPTASPRLGSFASSPVTTLRQLVRSRSTANTQRHMPMRLRIETQMMRRSGASGGGASSPAPSSISSISSPRAAAAAWGPLSPMSSSSLSTPPMSPVTPSSTTTSSTTTTTTPTTVDLASPFGSDSHGMRLVYPDSLSAKEEKALRATMQKAHKKFNVSEDWLTDPVSPAGCGLTNQLVQQSICQNEVLFSSEGLTLIALDGLYSLKSALSVYTKTKSPLRLEDAVDELRRLVLAGNGQKVSKVDILRSYDWLSISHSAIVDLDRMYKRAYGGPEGHGAITGMSPTRVRAIVPVPEIRVEEDRANEASTFVESSSTTSESEPATKTTEQQQQTNTKTPTLKLQTNFHSKSESPEGAALCAGTTTSGGEEEDDEEEDSAQTAKPKSRLPLKVQPWHHPSIDQQMLTPSPDTAGVRLGPITPNHSDDISPITRGEWGFLMLDSSLKTGRTVAVEMC